MATDPLFPVNTAEYANLLVEATDNSTRFCNTVSRMHGNQNGQKILRLALCPIKNNYKTIETLLFNELEGWYSYDIKHHIKILKINLVSCIEILNSETNLVKDLITIQVIEDLERYISNLKTICNFIYLIILKKKSTAVHKMLPTVSYTSCQVPTYICSSCGKPELNCKCFANLGNKTYNFFASFLAPLKIYLLYFLL